MKSFALGLLLFAAAAHAQASQLPGRGRITLMPGWNVAPDEPFLANVQRALGTTLEHSRIGAPTVWASFGYGANENVEVAVDLFGALESLKFQNTPAFQRLSYGAGLGPRFLWQVPVGSFEVQPHVVLGLMGVLVNTSGGGVSSSESFVTGYAAGAGVTLVTSPSFGVGLEYRFMYARGRAPGEVGGSINGGGHFLFVTLSWFLPGEAPHQTSLN